MLLIDGTGNKSIIGKFINVPSQSCSIWKIVGSIEKSFE